jgi:cytoskeletal protein RodZ
MAAGDAGREVCEMNLSFGARLRLQRERQQVLLDTIAMETKIKISLLEALERDDFSLWPEGLYRRAYLRSYAQAVGLDPETVVREFLELYPDPVEAPPDSLAEEASQSTLPYSAIRVKRLIASAIGPWRPSTVASLHQQPRETRTPPVPAPALPPRVPAAEVERRETALPLADAAVGESGPVQQLIEYQPVIASLDDMVDQAATVPDVRPVEARLTLDSRSEVRLPASPLAGYGEPGKPDATGMSETTNRLVSVASLCTRLAQVVECREIAPLLEDAAMLLDAVGLVVWSRDVHGSTLRPWLSYGYSDGTLARMRAVPRSADNAIAEAYRSADTCIVASADGTTGAIVVPMMSPGGCVGVLALEMQDGVEAREDVRAIASILAAQLVTMLGAEPLADAVSA